MLAFSPTAISAIVLTVIVVGYLLYTRASRNQAGPEFGSEIELAANRKPYYDDDVLEGKRLERFQFVGLLFLVVIVVGLPLYWILEPARQEGALAYSDERAIEWGRELFLPTAEGGFNCSGCHGGMKATGGAAQYAVTDPATNEVTSVNWFAPALNTVLYRFDEAEVTFILVYGRPFSPMSPWGLAGGGPMNDQQIETLVAYMKSIQIPRVGCAAGENEPLTCPSGTLPTEDQEAITAAAQLSVDNGTYATLGEALFNLDLSSGAYSCARCHTKGWSYGNPQVAAGGGMGPNLTGGSTNANFPLEINQIEFVQQGTEVGIKYGLQSQGTGRMPGFGNLLTDEQIKLIVEYVRSL